MTTKRTMTISAAATKQTTKRTAMTTTSYYKKRLEGINVNAVLLDLWKDAYSENVTTNTSSGAAETSSARIAAPHSESEAIEVLRKVGDPATLQKKKSKAAIVMPIRVLQSIRLLVPSATKESLDRALDDSSSSSSSGETVRTGLAFTPPYKPELTAERKKYLERVEKLKLKNEETKYSKITNNIKDQRQEDDKTTKSMTYAASIGINMIVAPISFGTFMYFFSGGVFDFFFPPDENDIWRKRNPTGVDVKRVIVGVVSGVIMMIIEMVLFVIRSHEFETHTTKKKKKRGVQPFGSYSANSALTYTDDSSKNRKTEDLADKKTK
jgi:hypothetical protein